MSNDRILIDSFAILFTANNNLANQLKTNFIRCSHAIRMNWLIKDDELIIIFSARVCVCKCMVYGSTFRTILVRSIPFGLSLFNSQSVAISVQPFRFDYTVFWPYKAKQRTTMPHVQRTVCRWYLKNAFCMCELHKIHGKLRDAR